MGCFFPPARPSPSTQITSIDSGPASHGDFGRVADGGGHAACAFQRCAVNDMFYDTLYETPQKGLGGVSAWAAVLCYETFYDTFYDPPEKMLGGVPHWAAVLLMTLFMTLWKRA